MKKEVQLGDADVSCCALNLPSVSSARIMEKSNNDLLFSFLLNNDLVFPIFASCIMAGQGCPLSQEHHQPTVF